MKHISEMSQLFANVVSRDQVLKERVIAFVEMCTNIVLENKQVIIGQTIVILQHLTFAQREVINRDCNTDALIEFINKNEHNFTIHEIIIR